MITRPLVTVMAAAIVVGPASRSTAQSVSTRREQVYVVRALPAGPATPATSYCDAANFPSTHPVVRERIYEYFPTRSEAVDGQLSNAAVQKVGGHRGCSTGAHQSFMGNDAARPLTLEYLLAMTDPVIGNCGYTAGPRTSVCAVGPGKADRVSADSLAVRRGLK